MSMLAVAAGTTPPAVDRRATGSAGTSRCAGSSAREWIKLRSVQSTVLIILAAAGAVIALGLLFTGTSSGSVGPDVIGLIRVRAIHRGQPGRRRPGQLIIGVLGVILVTGEYATGVIRSTLASVPRRIPVLSAKAIVLGSAILVSTLVASLAAFLGGQAILGAAGASIANPRRGAGRCRRRRLPGRGEPARSGRRRHPARYGLRPSPRCSPPCTWSRTLPAAPAELQRHRRPVPAVAGRHGVHGGQPPRRGRCRRGPASPSSPGTSWPRWPAPPCSSNAAARRACPADRGFLTPGSGSGIHDRSGLPAATRGVDPGEAQPGQPS